MPYIILVFDVWVIFGHGTGDETWRSVAILLMVISFPPSSSMHLVNPSFSIELEGALSDLNHLKCHHITNVLIHQSVSAILCRMARIVTTTITIKIQHHWQRESQFAS